MKNGVNNVFTTIWRLGASEHSEYSSVQNPREHECFLRYALKLRKCFADYETSRQRGGEQMIEFWRVFLALTPRMMSSNVCFFLSKKHFKALKYSLYDHIKQRMNENE